MIVFNNAQAGALIASKCNTVYNPNSDACIARVVAGEIVGGALYQAYTGKSIVMHMASVKSNWATPDGVWLAFHYPFVKLGVAIILGYVNSGNLRALRFNKGIGFKVEATIKDVYPDGDLVIMTMKPEDSLGLRIKPRTYTDLSMKK